MYSLVRLPNFILWLIAMLTSSLAELIYMLEGDSVEGWSIFLSFCVIFWCIGIIAWTAWQFFKSEFNYTFFRMRYFRELFRGLRFRWSARAYVIVQVVRKMLLILSVVGLNQAPGMVKISFFLTFQIAYLISVWVFFPFTEIKDNVSQNLH